jgi:hypothetical protein
MQLSTYLFHSPLVNEATEAVPSSLYNGKQTSEYVSQHRHFFLVSPSVPLSHV